MDEETSEQKKLKEEIKEMKNGDLKQKQNRKEINKERKK